MNSKKIQNVLAAIIKKDKHYLIAKRNRHKHLGLKWEFPGGKVHSNESFKNALIREIKEELNIVISIKNKQIGNYVFSNLIYSKSKSSQVTPYFFLFLPNDVTQFVCLSK